MSRVARNFREQSTFLYGLGHSKDFEPSGHDKNFRAGPNVYAVGDDDADKIIRIENNRAKIYRENQCCNALSCAALLGGLSLLGRR